MFPFTAVEGLSGGDFLQDKIMMGALAGLIGALVQDLYGYIVKMIGLSDRGFIDFARVVILVNVDGGAMETVSAFMAHLIWDLLLGMLFAYIIKNTPTRYYYLIALIYGLSLWFIIQAAGAVFRLPLFFHIPASAALVTLVGAIFYSLAIAFIIGFLEKRYN